MRQCRQFEDFLELVHFQHPIQQPGTILALGGLRLFELDLADDLLDDIVDWSAVPAGRQIHR